jgi:uncharacterized protein
MPRLKWERALVTGASEGIGEAFARNLARRRCDLVLVARRPEPLELLASELAASGIVAEVLAADLTQPEGLATVEARLQASERAIDLLVNNAGGASRLGSFLELDREVLTHDAYLNALVVLRLTHAAAGAMVGRGGGSVLNVSAGVAFYPLPGAAAYGASKAFVNSLSEAVSYELRGTGVQVSAVCPGFTHTGAQRRLGMTIDHLPRFLWMAPSEVADAALRAAERGRAISSLSLIGGVNALLGRHLPRRFLLPALARGQLRVTADGAIDRATPLSLAQLAETESRRRLFGVLLGGLVELPLVGPSLTRATRAPILIRFLSTRITRFHAWLLRCTRGRLRRSWLFAAGQPVLALTTLGRRSGLPRSTAVACFAFGDDLVLAAMNLGVPRDPAWALNLEANPDATIDIGGQTIPVTARRATGDDAAELWSRWLELQPSAEAFRELAQRDIPLFVLTRRGPPHADASATARAHRNRTRWLRPGGCAARVSRPGPRRVLRGDRGPRG